METFNLTIALPAATTFRRAGHDMQVDLSTIPAEIVARLVEHGLVQTVGDAASAAASGVYETSRTDDMPDWKTLPAAEKRAFTTANASQIAEYGFALMDKRVMALQAGDWAIRAPAAAGLAPDEAEIAVFLRDNNMVQAPKGLKTAEKLAAIWEAFAALPADKQKAVRDMIAAQRALSVKIVL